MTSDEVGSQSTAGSQRLSPDLRNSILAGLISGLLVVMAGLYLSFTATPLYSAQSSVILLPSSDLGPAQEAAYYEYLSRGQMVATFAEIGSNPQLLAQAQDKIGMSQADRAGSSVTLSVVPETSVVIAIATAATADQAVALANTTMELASGYLAELAVPFRAQVVAEATEASPTGPPAMLTLIATMVAALVTGVAVQQITQALLRWRRGRRAERPVPVPADEQSPATGGAVT